MNKLRLASIVFVLILVALLVLLLYRTTGHQDIRVSHIKSVVQKSSPLRTRLSPSVLHVASQHRRSHKEIPEQIQRSAPAPLFIYPTTQPDVALSFSHAVTPIPVTPMADINIALDPKPYKWRWVLTIPKPKHKNPNNTVVIRRGGVRPIQTEYIQRQKINANGLRSDPLLRQNLFQGFSTP